MMQAAPTPPSLGSGLRSGVRTAQQLLDAARGGDEEAFRLLVVPLRGQVYAYCRRLLGSEHDAEDVVQEVMLRAWRGLGAFRGRASLRTWLLRIATNACMSAIERRPKSVVPVDYDTASACPCGSVEDELAQAHAEIDTATESAYEQCEAVAAAAGLTLRHLPVTQRAVLILREVLGYSARETSMILETTVAAVNSALQRARANLDGVSHRNACLDPQGSEAWIQEAVEGLVQALNRGDVDTVVAIVADATLPSARAWSYSALPAY
jgi:RNA polymerase sigma-70 factor, ECF subfamily